MSEVTQVLDRLDRGDPKAAEQLLLCVYEELRRLAAQKMAQEQPGHTLQPTALVHEAWLRLSSEKQPAWQNRAHFFGAAAEAMRRILIDHARRKQAAKHGGRLERVALEQIDEPATADDDLLLRVNDALEKLAGEDPDAGKLVKLRFFAGLSVTETALAMGVSDRTARRYWRFARVWLREALSK
jgi:RNA polymerase sigma factor (TIGR02999 family)